MEKEKVKQLFCSITLVACVFALLVGFVFLYSRNLHRIFQEETIHSVGEVSSVSADSLVRRMNEELYNLECIAGLISDNGKNGVDRMVAELRNMEQEGKNHFIRICVIDRNGIAHLNDGTVYDVADREYFRLAMEGKENISDKLLDRLTGKMINVLAVPIYAEEEVTAVLIKVCANSSYQTSLEIKSFDNQGYSYMVKQNGDTVIASSQKTSFKNMKNIFESLNAADSRNNSNVRELQANMKERKTGYITFYNKVEKYLFYRPVAINDWYLLTVVPEEVAGEKQELVMNSTYVLCMVLVLFFGALVFVIADTQRKGRKQLEEVLFVDPLTGGRSFEKFRRDAKRILEKPEKPFCALVDIDIDKFKYINDSFGYEEGNEVLRFMWSMMRRVAVSGDLYARKAADEFVILTAYQTREELLERVKKLCHALSLNHKENHKQYEIIPSIGIYEIHGKGKGIDAMLDRAAMARKSVKGRRNNMYAFYDDTLRQKQNREKYIEDRMADALKNQEFIVYYQPKYNSATGRACGAEALVRWRDKSGELVMPGEFIPISESNGFIAELDKYVFEQVCRKLREWMREGKNIVPVSVNLSRIHLFNLNFVEEYVAIRQNYQIPDGLIQLELTESALFEQEERLVEVIHQLHQNGFDVLMDDFGTGYSSLYMLKNVSVEILKLDKKFVDDIGNTRGENVIDSIIKLAHSLHMRVTAEGVETGMQFEFLKKASCDEIQGFYFSKPVAEEEYEEILDELS